MKKQKLIIKVRGDTETDLQLALDEVKEQIKKGNLTGTDGNDTGYYFFDIKESD